MDSGMVIGQEGNQAGEHSSGAEGSLNAQQLEETLAGGIARQQLLAGLESGHKVFARWGSQGLSYVGRQVQLKEKRKAERESKSRRFEKRKT